MNLKAAAQALDVHYQTAYRWVRTGELVAVRVGSRYEVGEAAVENFQARRAALITAAHAAAAHPRDVSDSVARLRSLAIAPGSRLDDVLGALTRLCVAEMRGAVGVLRRDPEDLATWAVAAWRHDDPVREVWPGGRDGWRDQLLVGGHLDDVVGEPRIARTTHVPFSAGRLLGPTVFHEELDAVAVHSMLSVPIAVTGEPAWRLSATRDRPGEPFTEGDVETLERWASLMASVVADHRGAARAQARLGEICGALRTGLAQGAEDPVFTMVSTFASNTNTAVDSVRLVGAGGSVLAVTDAAAAALGDRAPAGAAADASDAPGPAGVEVGPEGPEVPGRGAGEYDRIHGVFDRFHGIVARVGESGPASAFQVHGEALRSAIGDLIGIVEVYEPMSAWPGLTGGE